MATNYTLPRKPQAGSEIKAGWGDEVLRAIRQVVPVQVPGMRISRGVYGTTYTPIAAATDITSFLNKGKILPFHVRWYSYDDGEEQNKGKGQWQIYLPLGCLTVEQGGIVYNYLPANAEAEDIDGEKIIDWYEIPEPTDTAYARIVKTEDRIQTAYTVYLNMKPWPRVKIGTSAYDEDFGPVEWQYAAAEMRITEYADREPTKSAVRLTNATSIAEKWDISQPFSIRYEIDPGRKASYDTPRILLTNQTRFIGRLQETVAEDTDVGAWQEIWVKIVHDGVEFSMSIERDLEGDDARSDDNKTVYMIYKLDDGVVAEDLRDYVPEMDFYTSPAKAPVSGTGS